MVAALMLPNAVLTDLKAGVRAALGPEPVLTTWWVHPASVTPANVNAGEKMHQRAGAKMHR